MHSSGAGEHPAGPVGRLQIRQRIWRVRIARQRSPRFARRNLWHAALFPRGPVRARLPSPRAALHQNVQQPARRAA